MHACDNGIKEYKINVGRTLFGIEFHVDFNFVNHLRRKLISEQVFQRQSSIKAFTIVNPMLWMFALNLNTN